MSLYKRKNSQVWWCRFQVRGQQIRRSTGEVSRSEAEKFERRLRLEAEDAIPQKPVRGIGLADLAGLDIERAVASGVSDAQLTSIEYSWKLVTQHFGPNAEPQSITFDGIQEYIAERRGKGVRGQSIRKDTQALKRGLEIARRKIVAA